MFCSAFVFVPVLGLTPSTARPASSRPLPSAVGARILRAEGATSAPISSRCLSAQRNVLYTVSGRCGTNETQMWCVTLNSLGLISTEVTQVSLVKPVGVTSVIHSITFLLGVACTVYGIPLMTMSGFVVHPFSGPWIAGGASLGLPCGAPLSTHRTMVSMSSCLSERSFEKWPY